MKNKTTSDAASALAKARWKKATAEERSEHGRKMAEGPRTAKRCFCGKNSMWRAANRYFDCCRKAGVITLNYEKREKHEPNEETRT